MSTVFHSCVLTSKHCWNSAVSYPVTSDIYACDNCCNYYCSPLQFRVQQYDKAVALITAFMHLQPMRWQCPAAVSLLICNPSLLTLGAMSCTVTTCHGCWLAAVLVSRNSSVKMPTGTAPSSWCCCSISSASPQLQYSLLLAPFMHVAAAAVAA